MLLQINKVQSIEAASTLSFSRRGKALNASADYKLACLGIWLAGWLTVDAPFQVWPTTRHFCDGFSLDFEKFFNYAPHVVQK